MNYPRTEQTNLVASRRSNLLGWPILPPRQIVNAPITWPHCSSTSLHSKIIRPAASQREDAALRRYLHGQTAKARSFMETALTYLLEHDNIELANTSSFVRRDLISAFFWIKKPAFYRLNSFLNRFCLHIELF